MMGKMPRKRNKKNLRQLSQKAYWEEMLARENLTMHQGESHKLSYVGNSTDLEKIEAYVRTDSGRVRPHETQE